MVRSGAAVPLVYIPSKMEHEPELAFVRWFTPTERPAHARHIRLRPSKCTAVGDDYSQLTVVICRGKAKFSGQTLSAWKTSRDQHKDHLLLQSLDWQYERHSVDWQSLQIIMSQWSRLNAVKLLIR